MRWQGPQLRRWLAGVDVGKCAARYNRQPRLASWKGKRGVWVWCLAVAVVDAVVLGRVPVTPWLTRFGKGCKVLHFIIVLQGTAALLEHHHHTRYDL